MRLKPELSKLIPIEEDNNSNVETSHFTTYDKKSKKYGLNSNRRALLVSSTSWTKGKHLF